MLMPYNHPKFLVKTKSKGFGAKMFDEGFSLLHYIRNVFKLKNTIQKTFLSSTEIAQTLQKDIVNNLFR